MTCNYVNNTYSLSDSLCRNKATIREFVCLHPPSVEHHQTDGEYGHYLGPEPYEYNKRSQYPGYYFCYPLYEDENHFVISACKYHHANPTRLRFDIQSTINAEKEERFNELSIVR
jgi:hypothetical protein